MSNWIQIFILTSTLVSACATHRHATGTRARQYTQDSTIATAADIEATISPYRDSLRNLLTQVIGTTETALLREKPEGTLGNLLADIFQEKAAQCQETTLAPDFCFLNHGGIRLPSLPKGEINRGNIYELMPFENHLVVMKLNGSLVLKIFQHIGAEGGWPISHNVRLVYHSDKKIKTAYINNRLLDTLAQYRVATNDYVATGGDRLFFLKGQKFSDCNVTLREAIFDYFEQQHKRKIAIGKPTMGRITFEK